jgi:hypothetical protein
MSTENILENNEDLQKSIDIISTYNNNPLFKDRLDILCNDRHVLKNTIIGINKAEKYVNLLLKLTEDIPYHHLAVTMFFLVNNSDTDLNFFNSETVKVRELMHVINELKKIHPNYIKKFCECK